MKHFVFMFLFVFMAAIGATAQHVSLYPSEGCVSEHYQDMTGWNTRATFTLNINTGKAQTLYFAAYNNCYGADRLELDIVCKNLGDGFKYHDSLFVEAYHPSERLTFISTAMLNDSYQWQTEVTVNYPPMYDFYAYWIYQRLNL